MKKLLFIGLLAGLITGVIFFSRTCIAEEDGRFLPEASQEGFMNGIPIASAGGTINEKDYVKGEFFVKFNLSPELFDKVPAEELFSATPELTEIANTYNIKTDSTKRLATALLNSPKADIRQAAAPLKNTFLIEADTDDPARLIEDLMKSDYVILAERVPYNVAYYVPDDYDASQQWYLDKIEAEDAWETYQASSDTSEVLIAIVDDAVKLDHEDLNFNLWVNPDEIPNNGIDDDNNGYIDDINGYDVANNDGDPNPPSTATNSYFHHGTHVAGIAAAVSNNNTGIASISGAGSNKAKIISVKTKLDSSPGGSLEATFQGVEYAIAADADIINMSWGSYGYSQTYQNLFETAHYSGITLVAAAGNNGVPAYMYPASYTYVISVGATDGADVKASWSNYGDRIDVMSPGVSIFSTLPVNNNSYGNLSGTSMASPLVAGLCGLMLSYNNTLDPWQIETLLEQNCDNIDSFNPNYIGLLGAGRINAYNVMQDLQAGNIPLEDFQSINAGLPGLAWASVAWGDYDNDGYLDFAVIGATHPSSDMHSRIYHNNGDDTFTDINAGLAAVMIGTAAWGDYDNDGYLDLLVSGYNNPGYITKIYRNNGNGTFTDINANLPGVLGAIGGGKNIAWGDYDNDGKQDILLTGYADSGTRIVKIYRNNGNGTFTDINANLPGIWQSSVAWGDYDNNGYLDIALTGSTTTGTTGFISKIYHNNGNGTFTDINAGFPNISHGSVAWGDYDNDGYLDVLLTGWDGIFTSGIHTFSKIYHNNGNGTFTENANTNFIGVHLGTAAWGDYDNDGYLDVLLTGRNNDNIDNVPVTKIYHNNTDGTFTDIDSGLPPLLYSDAKWGDYDNDGRLDIVLYGCLSMSIGSQFAEIYHNNTLTVNSIPNAPSGPQANVLGDDVTLSWQKATDVETPQDGLNYNIFIGTSPNLVDTLSPMAQLSNGWRRLAAIGSQNENTSWTINNLDDDTYYWGVQAIDTAFAGSTFALGTFTIGNSTTWTISGMVTLDGVGLPGIDLYEDGTSNVLATTGSSGYYEILDLPNGVPITVSPYRDPYTFDPTHIPYTGSTGNQENQDYVATLNAYTISGTVTLNGGGLEGVNLKDSQQNLLAITDSKGYYEFTREHGWTETVTPYEVGYIFNPGSRSYNLTANQIDQDYTAVLETYTVSGTVLDSNGNPIAGATVNGQDASDGNYSFTVNYGGSITLTPAALGYEFVPVSRAFTNITSNQTQNFVGNLLTYTISGTVTLNGQGLAGVDIKEGGVTLATTANDGTYSFIKDAFYTGTVTPEKTGHYFEPVFRKYINITSDYIEQDYEAILLDYTINGHVYLEDGTPVEGVELQDEYDAVLAITHEDGEYYFVKPYGWSGAVKPQKDGYKFDPDFRHYDFLDGDVGDQDYKAIPLTYMISGRVTWRDDVHNVAPLGDVALTDTETGETLAVTDDEGFYVIEVDSGWTGKIMPVKDSYIFGPESRSYQNVHEDWEEQDYKAKRGLYTISGFVYNIVFEPHQPVAGVSIIDVATGKPLAVTDFQGAYSFDKHPGWSGTVKPVKDPYTFVPAERVYVNLSGSIDNENYGATF